VRGTGNFTDWSVQAVYRAVGYFGSPLPDVPFDSVHGVIPNRAGRVVDPAKSNADAVSNADARNDNAEIAGPARNSGSEQPRENAGEIGGQVRNDDGNGSSGQAAVPSTDVYAAEGTAFDDDDFVVPKPASVRTGGGQSKLETRDDAGAQVPRLYTTGWIKRGPVGLIGSTKSDAAETVANLLADFASERPAPNRDPEAVVNLLRERAVQYLSWDDFVRLDNYEISLGKAAGRNRVKVVPRDEMISISQGK
jgi:NADPH-dependent glutamate synthase beta subunit-like oxidoreductase